MSWYIFLAIVLTRVNHGLFEMKYLSNTIQRFVESENLDLI